MFWKLRYFLLKDLGKSHFEVVGDILSILAMAVTNTKVMSIIELAHIWSKYESILIDFLRVVRNEAHACCKCVFSDDIPLYYFDELQIFSRRGRC